MVRKISVLSIVLVLIFGFAMTAQAETYSWHDGKYYAEGSVNNSNVINLAESIVAKYPYQDYLLFLEENNNHYNQLYHLIIGEMIMNDSGLYEFADAFVYDISVDTGEINIDDRYYESNVLVEGNGFIVYSSYKVDPSLIERGALIDEIQTILMAVLLLSFVLHSLFRPR